MNPYTTMGQSRIRECDIATILRSNRFMAAATLAALERQRAAQADAEVTWLLSSTTSPRMRPHRWSRCCGKGSARR